MMASELHDTAPAEFIEARAVFRFRVKKIKRNSVTIEWCDETGVPMRETLARGSFMTFIRTLAFTPPLAKR